MHTRTLQAGASCELWQWSEHPSIMPKCWIGQRGAIMGDGPYTTRTNTGPPLPPCPAGFTKNFTGVE